MTKKIKRKVIIEIEDHDGGLAFKRTIEPGIHPDEIERDKITGELRDSHALRAGFVIEGMMKDDNSPIRKGMEVFDIYKKAMSQAGDLIDKLKNGDGTPEQLEEIADMLFKMAKGTKLYNGG